MTEIFSPLSAAFFWLLEFLHLNLGISWSWSIVVLTVIVRIILIPLTWRQLKSMRAMQALAPQIKELQQKYKDDRQVLNQKTMEFYSQNKVSPFGSCLPLVLQLPVFLGLYYMLMAAGQAGGAFAPPNPVVGWLWIADITKFDYILMGLYIASQFVASWQMARKSPSQQKMMVYAMPFIVGIFMYVGKWPAGLFIYWVTSNLWTIVQQVVAEKVLPTPALVAPASGKSTPGKSPAKVATGKTAPTKTPPPKATQVKSTGVKSAPGQGTGTKTTSAKTPPGKGAAGKNAPGPGAPTKAAPATKATAPTKAAPATKATAPTKATPAKKTPNPSASAQTAPAKSTPAKTTPAVRTSEQQSAGTSGGNSGEQTGKQGPATTGESQRPNGGTSGAEGSG